ncbi:MAG: hypothetical protein IPJ88_13735 [Myxococcales bacterium]|nr:MAG: hypothetical protein IPJ88_13735 [Myxococcales bacterium]
MSCKDSSHRTQDAPAFRMLIPTELQEIDPRFVADAYSLKISRLVFASLVSIDPFSLEVTNQLAQSVQVLSPVRYLVRLKKGLRFSDGSALDAHDVVATFESIADPRLQSRYAQSYQNIQRIAVVDSHAVIFELKEAHAPFLTDLELPVLSSRYRERK